MAEVEEVLVQRQKIDYKYNEDNILIELQEYIDKTYDQHYSHKNFQATEFVIDSGHGEGFCIGNIMKYAQSCLLYTSPSPRDTPISRMPSSA